MGKNEASFLHLIEGEALVASPWKNGGGSTKQIAIHPPQASLDRGDFLWRLSTAEVQQPGPFSVFPDFDRLLTLVRGQELVLGLKGNREKLKPGKILHFPGEEAVTCEVPSGAVADLGFIYDRDQIFAKMSLVEFSRRPRSFALTAPTVLLFVILGSVSVSVFPGEHEFELECGDTFRIDPHYEERIVMLDPGFEKAQLAVIEISQLIAKSQS